ncbi:response regulator transcription factor [Streptomyces sp. SID13031]|uniref:response regulator transcription factor n=1 Tax=Streptomyces sp. SID13031 TaxID=2706046 RepID=UPI0013C6A05B|nr:response regulator transcription factor [Streptomyces sp. SID13031]NEA34975.1 response regulator transcription factor [Streptomyces sp. SID13031]
MTQGVVRVLVVEGGSVEAESRRRELRRQGYAVSSVDTGAKALQAHGRSDFVLLDLDLPDIDGLEVCRSIRAAGGKPIISVSSGDTETDRILALNAGADDCLDPRCGPREMLARIEAVLRRSLPCRQPDRVISLGTLRVDMQTHEARVRGEPVKLTGKEFELLHKLASHPDEALSRKQLMASVWETSWADSSRTIDTHVRSLRAKLGASSWIITVRGVGYRIGRG